MDIKRLVVFGDSLLDTGNVIKTLGVPGKPYHDGRFSNGLVSTEVLANLIAKDQGVEFVDHKNYAIGGAFYSWFKSTSLLKTMHSQFLSSLQGMKMKRGVLKKMTLL